MQLRLTEEIGREVRGLAEIESRAFQDELRHLLMLGLQQKRVELRKEVLGISGQPASSGRGEPAAASAVTGRHALSNEFADQAGASVPPTAKRSGR